VPRAAAKQDRFIERHGRDAYSVDWAMPTDTTGAGSG
jgi:hypothetical protein